MCSISQTERPNRTIKSILLAVGGNSLIRAGEKGTVAEQRANARCTAAAIVGLIRSGYRVIITHGNGPQVGAQLLRSERAADQVPIQTLDVCGAASQGEIGYLLSQSLQDELDAADLRAPVVSLITQTIVSARDPAMLHPTKPVGPFYSRDQAEERKRSLGWEIVEDAERGYRRVVPSPVPLQIVELEVIRKLTNQGVLVIACGGGGIPVVREQGELHGVEAVIDKDHASCLLALQLGVDIFVISTDTDYVYLDYKKPTQRPLTMVTVSELEQHYLSGHFPAGNMGPKIESALQFLRSGGKEVVITRYEQLCSAVAGKGGTHIVPDEQIATPSMYVLQGEVEVR
jgi:carbamate kinase